MKSFRLAKMSEASNEVDLEKLKIAGKVIMLLAQIGLGICSIGFSILIIKFVVEVLW
jgi:hypothetical protein